MKIFLKIQIFTTNVRAHSINTAQILRRNHSNLTGRTALRQNIFILGLEKIVFMVYNGYNNCLFKAQQGGKNDY